MATAGNPGERRPAPTVLQVLPQLVTGGVERGTVDLAAALTAAGWRAVVASAGGQMAREIERAGGVHVNLPLAAKSPFRIWRNAAALATVIARYDVDIVHARSRAPAWSALLAARRTGRHFVTTFHNAYGARSALKRLYNSVMARGERVIAISDFVARHVAAAYRVPPERLRIVPRGVDVARFDPSRVSPERVIEQARHLGIRDDAAVVLLPGRLTRWKGQLVLLDAVSRLGRDDLQCIILGSGRERYRRELIAAASRLGLASACRIVEDSGDMPAAYLLADVVVSASTEPEGFGRVAVEAEAMGRPVVATAHGASLETVIPGETGWLVPPGDAAALAQALRTALGLSPERRADLGARAREFVHARFTSALMAERTLAVYREVLGETPW
jgi:glycosyltransferase involved in cell wall biosynthesis